MTLPEKDGLGVVAYGEPPTRDGRTPGDQRCFAFGCLSSVILLVALMSIVGVRIWDGLTLFGEGSTPRAYLDSFAGLAGLGVAIGVLSKHWRYLVAVLLSAVIRAGIAVMLCSEGYLH